MFCVHIAQIQFNDANGFILMKWIHLIVSQLCRPFLFFFCENSFTSHKCSSFLNLIKCLAQFIMVVGGFRFVIRCDVDNRCEYLLKRFLVLFSRSDVSEGLFNHSPHCASDFLNSNLWTFRKMRGFSPMKKHWIKKQRCDRISVPI